MRYFPNLLLIIVLFVSGSMLAQDVGVFVPQQSPAAKKPPVANGSVMGNVVCADTHLPARGARIMVMPVGIFGQTESSETNDGQPHMAITALDGTFSVPHLRPGEYFVITFAAGYLSPVDGMMMPNNNSDSAGRKAAEALLRQKTPVVRINGQEAARIEIELQRGAIVAGKVIYSDGSPAAQLPVLLQKTELTKHESKPEELLDAGAFLGGFLLRQSPNTDDQGHFRISSIPGGQYRLAVSQAFEPSMNLGEDLVAEFNPGARKNGKLTVYSGNTFHQKDAKLYELRPGETVDGIEIILPLTGLHSIQGVATGKDGTPLNFGVLELSNTADPIMTFHTNIRTGGEFHFSGIPEGIYEVKITGGRIFENPPTFEFPDEQVSAMEDQFKPLRAFADTTVAVTVQATDISDLTVMLADTKLPERTAPAQGSEITSDVVVVRPQ